MDDVSLDVTELNFYINCMPIVMADPVHATWNAELFSSASADVDIAFDGALILVSSSLTSVLETDFGVFPDTFTLAAGGSASVGQLKESMVDTSMDECAAFCGTGSSFQLDLRATAPDGSAQEHTSLGSVTCVH